MHAALSLILTLFGVAVLFVAQDAHFLAAVQVIVYAGAIVVLFLFVIMLLGVDRAENLRVEPIQDPAAARRRSSASAWSALLIAGDRVGSRQRSAAASATGIDHRRTSATTDDGNIKQLAHDLFSNHVFAFELTSVLLVIAVVGTVLLARATARKSGASDAAMSGDRPCDARRIAPTPTWYLMLAAVLFGIGAVGRDGAPQPARDVHVRRADAQRRQPQLRRASRKRSATSAGRPAVFFVMVVAAAEVVVGLGIIVVDPAHAGRTPPPTISPELKG